MSLPIRECLEGGGDKKRRDGNNMWNQYACYLHLLLLYYRKEKGLPSDQESEGDGSPCGGEHDQYFANDEATEKATMEKKEDDYKDALPICSSSQM